MAIDERTRHRLYLRLEEVLGPGEAETLMEHLPPVGWADVATKRDLDLLRADLAAQLATMRAEVEALLADRLRAQTAVLLTTLIAGIGAVAAIARL